MPNEKPLEETGAPIPQPDAATTPVDLAAAFKMLNQSNREAAQEPVATGEADEGEAGEPVSADDAEGGSSIVSNEPAGAGGIVSGSSDVIGAIDFNAQKQSLLRGIQQRSIDEVRREFKESKIDYFSINELTQRDEQTGRIRFRNPDVADERDPNYYFDSRAEAQNFVDAWNKGVDNEFRRAVNERQSKLMQETEPTVRLLDFVPTYNAMDETTQKVFDSLIEPYAIKDNAGNEVGFNVDLQAAARQAELIAKQFAPIAGNKQADDQQTVSAPAVNDSPAVDMASGNGKSEDEAEPKSIGEALKLLDKKNRGGK